MHDDSALKANYREVMALIGEMAVEFATLEMLIDGLIRQSIGNPVAATLLIKRQTFARRLECLKALAVGQPEALAWCDLCDKVRKERNKYMHSAIGGDSAGRFSRFDNHANKIVPIDIAELAAVVDEIRAITSAGVPLFGSL